MSSRQPKAISPATTAPAAAITVAAAFTYATTVVAADAATAVHSLPLCYRPAGPVTRSPTA